MKSDILIRQTLFAILLVSLVLVFAGCDFLAGARGNVGDSTGKVLKDVVIAFQRDGHTTTRTNSSGTFDMVTIGAYCELTFSKEGYKPASVKVGGPIGGVRRLSVALASTNSAEASVIRAQRKVSK